MKPTRRATPPGPRRCSQEQPLRKRFPPPPWLQGSLRRSRGQTGLRHTDTTREGRPCPVRVSPFPAMPSQLDVTTKPRRRFRPHAWQAPPPSISVPSPIPKASSPTLWVASGSRRGSERPLSPVPQQQSALPPGSRRSGTATRRAPTCSHDFYFASFPYPAIPPGRLVGQRPSWLRGAIFSLSWGEEQGGHGSPEGKASWREPFLGRLHE